LGVLLACPRSPSGILISTAGADGINYPSLVPITIIYFYNNQMLDTMICCCQHHHHLKINFHVDDLTHPGGIDPRRPMDRRFGHLGGCTLRHRPTTLCWTFAITTIIQSEITVNKQSVHFRRLPSRSPTSFNGSVSSSVDNPIFLFCSRARFPAEHSALVRDLGRKQFVVWSLV
jgi:hypothetical protein